MGVEGVTEASFTSDMFVACLGLAGLCPSALSEEVRKLREPQLYNRPGLRSRAETANCIGRGCPNPIFLGRGGLGKGRFWTKNVHGMEGVTTSERSANYGSLPCRVQKRA